jgi:RNA polymerase sigma-70 factor (ECF subfamily)
MHLSSIGEQSPSPACPPKTKGEAEAGLAQAETLGRATASPCDPLDQERVEAIVRRAQAGDRAAMEALLATFQDRTWRRALYRLGDHDEAWEVVQDVFVICFRKIGQFRGEAQFWTWLARIVDNHVKNRLAWWRRHGRSVTFSLEELGGGADAHDGAEKAWDPPSTEPSPRRQAAARQEVALLKAAMAKLSEERREILLLRFADELSYEEIAESLQISMGTVKSRINRARADLRQLMKDVL